MLHPSMRCVLIIAMITQSGCESFGLNFGRSQTEVETVEPVTPAAKTVTLSKLQVAVLDPDNFAQAKARHKQVLMETGDQSLSGAEVGYYMDVQKAQFIQLLRNEKVAIEHEGAHIILNLPGADSFGSNSDRLKSGAQKFLTSISRVLDEYRKTQITVHGHTDDVGEEKYNQKLSERRALSVARYLVDSGIAKQRIAIVGYGESQPVSSNATPGGRAQNRRIELHLDPIAN